MVGTNSVGAVFDVVAGLSSSRDVGVGGPAVAEVNDAGDRGGVAGVMGWLPGPWGLGDRGAADGVKLDGTAELAGMSGDGFNRRAGESRQRLEPGEHWQSRLGSDLFYGMK